MKIKWEFLHFVTFIDESQIQIKEDKWLVNKTLREQYPILHNIARHKQYTVAVLNTNIPTLNKQIWILKSQLKIKIFSQGNYVEGLFWPKIT